MSECAPVSTADTTKSDRSARFAVATACIGSFMILLDGSIVNIVLPSIQRDVHGTIAGLQWVVTIYTIPLASVLLTAGDLGDRLGTRRLFVWSLGLFTVASLCCAASPSLEVLLAARAVQGVAAGGVLPTTLAIIAHAYRDNTRRTKAITTWAASGGLALLLGPVLGGLLSEVFGWRAVFFVNLPIGLVALALALRHLRQATARSAKTPDLLGQAIGVLALAALVAGLIEGGSRGWAVPSTLVLLAVSVFGVATFVVVERRSSHPVLPPAIFRRKEFTASIVSGQAYQIGSFGMQFMLAIFVQQQWHVDTARTGVLFLPFSVGSVVGVLGLNRGLLRLGPRRLLSVGSVVAFAGAVVMLGVSGHEPSWPAFAVGTALIGLGSGMFAPSINAVTMQSIEPEYSGLASGVLNTARQIGMAVGVAVLGAFIAMSDPVLGMRIGMGLVGLCFLTVLVLGLRFVPARRR